MSETDQVVVSTQVRVETRVAFEVFTREIDAWWRHGARYRQAMGAISLEPGVGGRLVEEMNGEIAELGRVRVWEPGRRLVLAWHGHGLGPEDPTEVEVLFETIATGSRVSIEHRGWDRVAANHRARRGLEGPAFRAMVGLWWGDLLVSLARTAVVCEDRR